MADAGLMGGIGSAAEGFLAGRAAKRAQQAQDLEQQKYETYKEQLGETNAQKQRELDIQALGTAAHGYGEVGSDTGEAIANRLHNLWGPGGPSGQQQPQDQPQDGQADQINSMYGGPSDASGLMNHNPTGGLVPQSQPSPYSTVPSVTSQMNPGAPVPQSPGAVPHTPPLLVRQAQMAQLKDANDKVNAVLEKGGQAKVVYDQTGTPRPQIISLGPQANEEINNLRHGGRSAENAVNSQYGESTAIKTAHGAQPYMAQMLEAFKTPSPQADASMVLNAYKIKFPNQAPDVNSIEELQNSQSVPDTWKSKVSKALNGQFDAGTRQNLMRDAISTYQPFVESMQTEQKKYLSKSKNAGVNGELITSEPAVMKTFQEAMALKDQMGPYKPPSERGGLMNTINGLAGSMFGVKPTQNAAPSAPKVGASVKGYVFLGGDPSKQESWRKQ